GLKDRGIALSGDVFAEQSGHDQHVPWSIDFGVIGLDPGFVRARPRQCRLDEALAGPQQFLVQLADVILAGEVLAVDLRLAETPPWAGASGPGAGTGSKTWNLGRHAPDKEIIVVPEVHVRDDVVGATPRFVL